jgi:hypothetical protein
MKIPVTEQKKAALGAACPVREEPYLRANTQEKIRLMSMCRSLQIRVRLNGEPNTHQRQ